MSVARTITNRYQDFHLLEVGKTTSHPEKRGPFMIVQTGSAPGDPEVRECTFALTRKGTWIHCFIFFLMPKNIRREVAVFETVPETMELAESLTGKPVVETMTSLPSLLQGAGFHPADDDPAVATLMDELKKRHPRKENP